MFIRYLIKDSKFYKMSDLKNLSFERLKGRENFGEWKVGAKAYLITKGHWKYVSTALTSSASEGDITLNQKALAEIILLLDTSLYSYVADCNEAKTAWDTLTSVFEDSGS